MLRNKVESSSSVNCNPALLELIKVGRIYKGHSSVVALKDVSLSIYGGEYVAFTGPSGSGKSTLLNIIGLLDRPTFGSLMVDGVYADHLNEDEYTRLRSEKIGFIFQAFNLLPYRSALENVELGLVYAGVKKRIRTSEAKQYISKVGLTHRENDIAANLSGGERQRIAIARAMISKPAFLLCDEPTGNLDSNSADNILDLLGELNDSGVTILIVTHDPKVASKAFRQIAIKDGEVMADLSSEKTVRVQNTIT